MHFCICLTSVFIRYSAKNRNSLSVDKLGGVQGTLPTCNWNTRASTQRHPGWSVLMAVTQEYNGRTVQSWT